MSSGLIWETGSSTLTGASFEIGMDVNAQALVLEESNSGGRRVTERVRSNQSLTPRVVILTVIPAEYEAIQEHVTDVWAETSAVPSIDAGSFLRLRSRVGRRIG